MGNLRMAEVTARQRAILMTIVERYIETGEPVGSGTIAAAMGSTNVSSATVRNEMVALAEAGLLEQPHTSAGRVPTARAFRCMWTGWASRSGRRACRRRVSTGRGRDRRAVCRCGRDAGGAGAHEPCAGDAFERCRRGDCRGAGRRICWSMCIFRGWLRRGCWRWW